MKLTPLTVPIVALLLTTGCQAQEAEPAAAEGTAPVALSAEEQAAPAAAEQSAPWAVVCEQSGNGSCVVRQYLLREGDRQQILMAGLLPASGGEAASMRLVLPFGLDPAAPVAIGVDGQALASPPLRTCLPTGCEAVTTLDGQALAMLRAGRRLEIGLRVAGGGNLALPLDLAGFAAAFDRAAQGQGTGGQAQ